MKESIMGIHLFNVKSIDEYWLHLEKNLEFLLPCLQNKHEYGTSHLCSERGIQQALAFSAQRIAEENGLNMHKTVCICLAVGLCFPEYGSYGMAAYENYIRGKNIPWNIEELKIGAIESCITQSGSVVTPQLDGMLHTYYENRTDIPEVNVARYCQIRIQESRTLMKKGISASESIFKIMNFAEKNFSVEKSIFIKNNTRIDVPIEIQEKVNKDLDCFINYLGLPDGIFKFLI